MYYLTTSFSLNMWGIKEAPKESGECRRLFLDISTVLEDDVRGMVLRGELVSAVGHAATAEVLTERLGVPIKANRQDILFPAPDVEGLIVAQLPRPKEGQIYTAEEIRQYPVIFFQIEELAVWDAE